jgi:hypothetical protein
MATLMGTLIRIVLAIALIAALAAAPLFFVQRSKCRERGKQRTHWAFVLPGDEPPRGCRGEQNGLEVLRDYVGLE